MFYELRAHLLGTPRGHDVHADQLCPGSVHIAEAA